MRFALLVFCLALPDVARADGGAVPKRFIGSYVPNGVFTPQWFPTAGANEQTFTLGAMKEILFENVSGAASRPREQIVEDLFNLLERGYLRVELKR